MLLLVKILFRLGMEIFGIFWKGGEGDFGGNLWRS